MFLNVAVQDHRHNSNHYMVLGCLHGITLREYQLYFGLCMRLPLYLPKQLSREYSLFSSLRKVVPNTSARERAHASWILEEAWRVINARVSFWRSPYRFQRCVLYIGRQVKLLLDAYRQRRETELGTVVETLLAYDPPVVN